MVQEAITTRSWLNSHFRSFETSFIPILSLLWPKDLFENDSSDHHHKDKDPHEDQNARRDTTKNLDCVRLKRFSDCERGSH